MLRYRLLNIIFQLSNMTKKHILCLIQLLLPINGIGDWSPTGLIFAVFQRSFSISTATNRRKASDYCVTQINTDTFIVL